ncbi:MAG: hypothetical protein RI996_496 [Candidatus Parcubacteria bacterium]|jgi:hypothetical protein
MKNKLYILAICLCFLPICVFAINVITDGFQVSSSPLSIDAHGTCKSLSATDGQTYFVPTKTDIEWQAFINNKPAGIQSSVCGCQIEKFQCTVDRDRKNGVNHSYILEVTRNITSNISTYQIPLGGYNYDWRTNTNIQKCNNYGLVDTSGNQMYFSCPTRETAYSPEGCSFYDVNKTTPTIDTTYSPVPRLCPTQPDPTPEPDIPPEIDYR